MKKIMMACIVMAIIGLGIASQVLPVTYKATHKNPATGMKEPQMTQGTIDFFKSRGGIDAESRAVILNRIDNGMPGVSDADKENLKNQLNALPSK